MTNKQAIKQVIAGVFLGVAIALLIFYIAKRLNKEEYYRPYYGHLRDSTHGKTFVLIQDFQAFSISNDIFRTVNNNPTSDGVQYEAKITTTQPIILIPEAFDNGSLDPIKYSPANTIIKIPQVNGARIDYTVYYLTRLHVQDLLNYGNNPGGYFLFTPDQQIFDDGLTHLYYKITIYNKAGAIVPPQDNWPDRLVCLDPCPPARPY